jgi:hypothetical protein
VLGRSNWGSRIRGQVPPGCCSAVMWIDKHLVKYSIDVKAAVVAINYRLVMALLVTVLCKIELR